MFIQKICRHKNIFKWPCCQHVQTCAGLGDKLHSSVSCTLHLAFPKELPGVSWDVVIAKWMYHHNLALRSLPRSISRWLVLVLAFEKSLVGFRVKSEKTFLDAEYALFNQLIIWNRNSVVHQIGFHHCTDPPMLLLGAADWLLGTYEIQRANTVFSVQLFY